MPILNLTQEGRLYYDIKGAPPPAPPVLFLNGTAQTTLTWTHLVRALAGDCQTICYDARSQGRKSVLGQGRLSLDLHLKDLLSLLDHLGLARPHLVGMSHGALLALALSARHPERAASMVLINPGNPAGGRTRTVLRAWHEVLAQGGMQAAAWAMLPLVLGGTYLKSRQALLTGMAEAIAVRNRPESLESHLAAMAEYPAFSTFTESDLPPTLLVTGGDDPLNDPQWIDRLVAECAAEHLHLADAGHSLPVEAPRRCSEILKTWLAAHS
jgi:pimeloyl-ACP methyl ester carboxylesterase